MRPNFLVLTLVGLGCGLSLCVARTTAAQAPAPPCTFLTAAQVGGAIGSKVDAGEAIGTTGCSWSTPAGTTHVVVTLSFWPPQRFGEMPPMPNVTRVNLNGVGDQAFYVTMGTLTSLSVKRKSSVFVLHVYGLPGTQKQMAAEKSLALDVVSKL